jgi:oligopeptide transport system permease protein
VSQILFISFFIALLLFTYMLGLRYMFWRLLGLIPLLFLIASLAFILVKSVKGGPFDHDRQTPEIKRQMEKRYHLDQPIYLQYVRYMKMIFVDFDFGPSMKYRDWSVNDIIAQSFPVSITLGSFALCFALIVGCTMGILSAVRQNTWIDYTTMSFALLGVSIPSFLVGSGLLLFCAFYLKILPPAGWGDFQHIILPGITLGLPYVAYCARLSRAGMLEVVNQDFVRTAKAKGLRGSVIVLRHTLRGGLLPVVSFLGPAAAGILTGSLVVEKIFKVPGLGYHFVQSAFNRDYPLVLGTILLYSVLLIFFNLIVDIAYALLDPRVQLK